jgi:hypothetical protein
MKGCLGGVRDSARRDMWRTRRSGRRPTAIVQPMLPLAALGGTVVIGVAVSAAALLVWWLLRGERRDEEAQQAEEEAARLAAAQAGVETDEQQLDPR